MHTKFSQTRQLEDDMTAKWDTIHVDVHRSVSRQNNVGAGIRALTHHHLLLPRAAVEAILTGQRFNALRVLRGKWRILYHGALELRARIELDTAVVLRLGRRDRHSVPR